MPSFDTLAPGPEPVAAYQPLFELGRGGMGTVHLARAVGAGGFERLVVVKRLKQELVSFPEAVQRFLGEARHAALIHHANVVGTHQIGRDQDGYFLVLDYVEGGSLDELVRRATQRRQSVPTSVVLRVALDALAGLSAAHGATDPSGRPLGMLHRDVSPQNVLVGRDGVTRLADFGVAKSALASVQTDQRYLVGKLLYLPPEYLARKPVGPTLDIYSLGVTLWTALSGSEPWPNASEAELVTRICQERIPSLHGVGVRVAPQVEALVMRACDPEPAQRFASAREMADEIEMLARETGWVASHADVADLLEDLIGSDLARRRERVASVVATLPKPDLPSDEVHRSVPPGALGDAATRRVAWSAKTERVEVPVNRARTPLLVGVSAGVVVLLGVGLYAVAGRVPDGDVQRGANAEPSSPAPHEATTVAPLATTAVVSSTVAIEPAPTTQPSELRHEAAPHGKENGANSPARSTGPTKAPSRADQRAPAQAPTATPVTPVVAPAPQGPAAPDSISKSNPYR